MKAETIKNKLKRPENRKTMMDLGILLLLVTIAACIAYGVNGIYPFGSKSIARGDMVQQTIPAGMYYVWDVLHGKASPFFTWNSGLGMNISGAVSLGALFSPLNLFLYFSTRAYLYYFANILMILKMIAIAYAMYFYLRKYDMERMAYVAGAAVYAFGAASLVHFQIMLVMDVAFLLPLIMIGIDRLYENKGCLYFIIVFTLAMMVDVYTGCITLLFILLSSGIRTFVDSAKEKEEKKRWILRLGVSVLVSLLLSAVVVIPALRSIAEAPRSGDGDYLATYATALQAQWSGYEWSMVRRMYVNMALPFACIVGFFVIGDGQKGERRKYKGHMILTLLMLVSMIIPSVELLWHGGSRASWPVRFIYVVSFVLIDFAALLYQDHREKDETQKEDVFRSLCIACVCLAAALIAGRVIYKAYAAYCGHSSYATLGDGFLCLVIEAVFAGLYLFILKSHKRKTAVLVLMCAQLVATSVICFATNKENATVFSSEYLEAANNAGKSVTTDIKDFERIKNTDYKIDHIDYALVMGQEAISNYWHVINPDLQPNFAALGYSINWTQLLDAGGTIFSDTLLHIQYDLSYRNLPESMYSLCENVEGYNGDQIGLYKNNLELPFAIGTDTYELSAGSDLFSTQNSLFSAITGSNETLIRDVSGELDTTDLTYETNVTGGRKVLYFYGTNNTDLQETITVNGQEVYIPNSDSSENTSYPVDFGNGLICLGSFENESVSVEFNGEADLSQLHIGWLDYDLLTGAVKEIQDQNPKITTLKQKNSGVKLKLDNVTKSNVFLPISYDKGWSCKVNGKKVEIGSIDGMLSIPVEQGSDNIVLKYRPSGRTPGLIISLITLLICVAGRYLFKKGIVKQDQKTEGVLGSIAYDIYGVVYALFIALLFIVPILCYLRQILVLIQS